MHITAKFSENLDIPIQPFIRPRLVYYSKEFKKSYVYSCFADIGDDFGKNHPFMAYVNIGFKYTSPIFIINNIDELESYDIVTYDKTVDVSEFYNRDKNVEYIQLFDMFKDVYFNKLKD